MKNKSPAGFTLLELLVVLGIIAVLVALLLPAVQRAREMAGRAQCGNNLHQIALALQSYHDAAAVYPPGTSVRSFPYRYMSWQTRILPYLEQGPLWSRAMSDFQVNRNFAHPPHVGLQTVLPIYICPSDGREYGTTTPGNVTAAFTHYQGVSGINANEGILFVDSRIRLADVRDGTTQTLIVGERPPSDDNFFGWWYAGVGQRFDGCADAYLGVRQTNYTYRLPNCPRGPYHFVAGGAPDSCDALHYWSQHPGGANFVFADGSLHFLLYSADDILPALSTRAGGEVVSVP